MADAATDEKTYLIPVEGLDEEKYRDEVTGEMPSIVMRPPNEGAWAVFSRVNEQLKAANRMPAAERAQFAIRSVALVMQVLDQCVVGENDKAWVDSLVATGELSVANAMGLVSETARQHYATEKASTAPANGPVRLTR